MKCVILAPATIMTPQGTYVKTDAWDARAIAPFLSYGGYHALYIPTDEDDSMKVNLRIKDAISLH